MSVKVEQRRAGLAVVCAAALMALLASCNWDFLNGDDTDGEATYHYKTYEDDRGRVVTMECYNASEVLQWYERYGYDDDDNRIETQRFSADDVLQYTYLYDWQDGKNTIEAYFDGDNTLRWYDHSTYDGDLLVELCEYDGDDALQWFEVYEYSATGKQTLAVRYDGDSLLVGASAFEYDAEDLLVVDKSYDENGDLCAKVTHEWNAEGKETRSVTYRAPDTTASLAPPSARPVGAVAGRAAGAEPALPEPPAPPDAPSVTLTEQDLEVAARSFWFYDAYGTTGVTTTAEYLPTAIARQDTRLEEDVSVALGYDEAGRITSKATSYGDTEALKILLTYRDASGYYVSHIQSSGAAMLVPLNFDLSYDDAGLPTEVVIGYDTSTLFTLTYAYEADNPLKHTITVKDGDRNLYGCYVFTLASDYLSARIDVYTDAACTKHNGFYKLAYDEDSRTVSFTSYNASGKPVQRYSYGYEDLEGLGGQALMVAESKFGFVPGDDQGYDAVMKEIEASDFDFATLLRIRSAEDVADLFL